MDRYFLGVAKKREAEWAQRPDLLDQNVYSLYRDGEFLAEFTIRIVGAYTNEG